MIFWKSWNWPSYSRECLLYWLRWQLVIETSSLTVKKPKFASRYYGLWMWRHLRTRHRSCSSPPTDYGNSHVSGSKIQNPMITGHFSQLKMSGPLWSMSWIDAISILDPVDVKEAYSFIASCDHSVQRHVPSHGQRDASFGQEQDSMEGRLVLRCEVSSTEADKILCWCDSNNGHAAHFFPYPRSFSEVAIV